jgi:hypothetical protein
VSDLGDFITNDEILEIIPNASVIIDVNKSMKKINGHRYIYSEPFNLDDYTDFITFMSEVVVVTGDNFLGVSLSIGSSFTDDPSIAAPCMLMLNAKLHGEVMQFQWMETCLRNNSEIAKLIPEGTGDWKLMKPEKDYYGPLDRERDRCPFLTVFFIFYLSAVERFVYCNNVIPVEL